jgi:hypothetical protein
MRHSRLRRYLPRQQTKPIESPAMRRACLAVLAIAVASPALADATTYKGTLGKLPVVVEFTVGIEDASESFAGRYFYANKGIDIPLDAVTVQPGKVELTEETTCTREICEQPFADSIFPEAVRGATWSLESADDGETITGSWQAEGGKPLKIALDRVGGRIIEETPPITPQSLTLYTYQYTRGQKPLTMETAPYDFIRTDVELTLDTETRWGPVAFTYATDPRTKFRFPRITDLGGADFTAANTRLATEQALMSIDALGCEAQQYYGTGWTPGMEYFAGTLAGYPDESVEVIYLTPTVMSWTEGGSLFCGGAHPENHYNYFNMDVQTGKDIDLSLIFEDSKQGEYRWEPGPSLIEFARSRRVKSDDAAFEEDCGMDDLIGEYLAVSFRQGDRVVFTLQGLPHAIMACGEDIYEAPITELVPLLASTAADYFPVLAD